MDAHVWSVSEPDSDDDGAHTPSPRACNDDSGDETPGRPYTGGGRAICVSEVLPPVGTGWEGGVTEAPNSAASSSTDPYPNPSNELRKTRRGRPIGTIGTPQERRFLQARWAAREAAAETDSPAQPSPRGPARTIVPTSCNRTSDALVGFVKPLGGGSAP